MLWQGDFHSEIAGFAATLFISMTRSIVEGETVSRRMLSHKLKHLNYPKPGRFVHRYLTTPD